MRRLRISIPLMLFVLSFASLPALAQTNNPTLNEAIALHGQGNVTQALVKYQQVANTSDVETEIKHAYFAVGACQFSLKQYNAAMTTFMQFANDYPDDFQAPLAIIQTGNCLAEQGRILEAEPYYANALTIEQSEPNMQVWIGWAHLGMGRVLVYKTRFTEAIPYLKEAINQASEVKVSDEARDLLKQCFVQIEQSSKATASMEITSATRKVIGEADLAMGKLYYDQRRFDQALPYLKHSISTSTDGDVLAESYDLAAECLFNLIQDDDAIASAQAIENISDTRASFKAKRGDWVLKAMRWKIRVLLRRKQNTNAVQACDALMDKYSYADQGYVRDMKLLKANALMNDGKLEQALDIVRALHAENISEEWNLNTDALIGDYLLQAKDYSGAIQAYLNVLGQRMNQKEINAGTLYKLAYCYKMQRAFGKAKDYLNEILNKYSETSWREPAQKALTNWAHSATEPNGEGLR